MKPRPSNPVGGKTPARQVARFITRFDPAIARLARSARAMLRKRMPTAIEIVYDNYNVLVLGFGTTERPSDCIVAVCAYPRHVTLSFYYGVELPDPEGLLRGSGTQHRSMPLESAEVLERPAVQALIEAAIANAMTPLRTEGRGYTVIRLIAAKQRPRRPHS